MVRNYFHLVPRLKRDIYCDAHRDEIERCLLKSGEWDRRFPVAVTEENGLDVDLEIRVVFHRNGPLATQLSVAVLLHDIRISGIDWEGRFDDCNGERKRGWHRHLWDPKVKNADSRKMALAGLDSSFTDVSGFVLRAVEELGIVLNGKDYGDTQQQMQWA